MDAGLGSSGAGESGYWPLRGNRMGTLSSSSSSEELSSNRASSCSLLSPVAREFGTASRGFVVTTRASFSLGVDSNRLQADPDLSSVGGWVLMNVCWVGFSFVIAQYYNFNRNLLYWYQVPSSSLEIAKEVFTSALYILSSDIPEGSLSSHMRRIWSSLLLGSLHPF